MQVDIGSSNQTDPEAATGKITNNISDTPECIRKFQYPYSFFFNIWLGAGRERLTSR